ncbi:MAG TPA: tRNA isopentenyl-2-thiomethyl-A-37 hydroxylase MiaE [Thermoanaerobaculia bacterium]|jgi:tRNA-(ms[2]io[6]A)-hydroxylase|nr:tRNA isopentenyl-2-thiomethyl-A-37 hydroxylase MiaE [Thermoanaerobaculia bacterium]
MRRTSERGEAQKPVDFEEVYASLPLLHATPRSWAEIAAANLPELLADHAVCEQQVAMYALSLAAYYPQDAELVEQAAALAAEEVQHFRRVIAILTRRGWPLGGRRKNRWAQSLRERIVVGREPWTKVDRLLFGALVEARSCERFTRLAEVVEDREVIRLLADLGPAERRHWELFYRLAERGVDPQALADRFMGWREFEAELARGLGVAPAIHG